MEPLVDPLQTSKLYYSALAYNYKTRIYGKGKIRIGSGSTPKKLDKVRTRKKESSVK